MCEYKYKWRPDDIFILNSLPVGLLQGLPEEDQIALQSVIGRPIKYVGDSFGQAELEFVDDAGNTHTIWVDPAFLNVMD